MKKARSIHIVIADDHSIVREGLTAILKREPDIAIVGQASNWLEAVEQVLQKRPEIAVLDLHMRGMEPADGVATLCKKFPAARIIIYSAFSTDEEVYQVFSAGARGYVMKGESGREDLLKCIRAVSQGEIWIHPIAAANLAERMSARDLTPREKEILRLIAVGKSNKEIGSSIDVTEGTVKVHVNHILAKLGVAGRVEAIKVAVQRGYVHLLGNPPAPTHTPNSPRPSSKDISKGIGPFNSTSQLPTKE